MLKFSWLKYGFCLAVAFAVGIGGASAEQLVYIAPDSGEFIVFDEANPPEAFRQSSAPTKQLKGGTIVWNITYQDVVDGNGIGFDDATNGAARQATAEAVLDYIASILNESTGAQVDVNFTVSQTDGSGFLGTAGPFYSLSNGFANGTAFEHITTGVDPSGSVVDITCTMDFGHNYLNDHTQMPSGGQNDLFSVLLHEMTHGLGIASGSGSDGNSSITGGNPGRYTVWDQLMRSGTDVIWNASTTALESGITAATFTSDNLFFSGANAAAAHGSNAPIYAPGTFATGSSLSHFKTGSVDSVMEHVIVTGVAEREYSDTDIGALVDIGYTNASATPVSNATIESQTGFGFYEEGDAVTLSVTVSGTVDPVTYQWQKDGSAVSDGGNISGATTTTLTIDPAQTGDTGVYRLLGDDAAKAPFSSGFLAVTVVPAGSLPAAGVAALGLLAGLLTAGGVVATRRRRN